jgi:Rrf2 family protein
MRITAQSDYAIRAVFDLAYHAGGNSTRAEEVAARQGISTSFLEQIFWKLKQAGMIGSKRGPHGGYHLVRPAGEITVYDIVTAVEGPIELVFCVSREKDQNPCCGQQGACVARPLWQEIGDNISEILKDSTIEDLCRRAEKAGIPRAMDARLTFDI